MTTSELRKVRVLASDPAKQTDCVLAFSEISVLEPRRGLVGVQMRQISPHPSFLSTLCPLHTAIQLSLKLTPLASRILSFQISLAQSPKADYPPCFSPTLLLPFTLFSEGLWSSPQTPPSACTFILWLPALT